MIKNIFLILGGILVILICYFGYQIETPYSLSGEFKKIEIRKGASLNEIAKILKESKIIRSQKFFKFYILLKGWQKQLKAGSYKLCGCRAISEIARTLKIGERKQEKEITILEGWSIYEIDKKLSAEGIIKPKSLISFLPSPALKEKYPFLLEVPKGQNLEGFLFPDTYRFFKNQNKDVSLVAEKFLKNFQKKVYERYSQEIERKSKRLYEVLILASLLEKEVIDFKEKRIASGILWKRLKLAKPLEVDAALIYGKQKKFQKTWKEVLPLKKFDFSLNSLYNTYIHPGLPPTPICNPSLASIKAAIFPQKSSYLYYLTDPKTKKTYFSKSYQNHLYLRKKYLGF